MCTVCLAWGHSIVVAGNDGAVVFYNETGEVEKRFDSTVPSERANLEVSMTPEAKTRGEFELRALIHRDTLCLVTGFVLPYVQSTSDS